MKADEDLLHVGDMEKPGSSRAASKIGETLSIVGEATPSMTTPSDSPLGKVFIFTIIVRSLFTARIQGPSIFLQ
jgi:hypothetical protein